MADRMSPEEAAIALVAAMRDGEDMAIKFMEGYLAGFPKKKTWVAAMTVLGIVAGHLGEILDHCEEASAFYAGMIVHIARRDLD